MALAFLLDENVRGRLWQAIERYNATADWPLDVIQVGDSSDLPLGMSDPEVPDWIEREFRLLVSLDKNTLPGHLERHLAAGHHLPGILLIRRGTSLAPLVEYLVAVAYVSEALEWQDRTKPGSGTSEIRNWPEDRCHYQQSFVWPIPNFRSA